VSAVLEAREPSARYLEAVPPVLVRQFGLLATASGGVARLRELILTLAVQGKLVAQDPSDEPARPLLKTISAEKDRLIAEGRIKPDKPLSAQVDHCPFEIPDTWTWVPMGEVVEIVRGITFSAGEKTKEAAPGRIACLRTANVQEAIEWDDLLFVNRSFMGRDDQLLKLHDIVMSMANSRELVGKVALVDHIPHPESTFGGFLGVLRPWKIDPRYAMALLRSSYARSTLIDSSSQTTNIANISLGKLRPLPFPLPPLAEQARIVARVDELMRLCDALEAQGRLEAEQHARLLATLLGTLTDSSTPEELAANWQRIAAHFDLLFDRPAAVDALEQIVLQLAVHGLLVPQDPSDEPAKDLLERITTDRDQLIAEGKLAKRNGAVGAGEADPPFDIPKSWQWVKFSDYIHELCTGPFGSVIHKEDYIEGGVPLINPSHMIGGRIQHDASISVAAEMANRLSAYQLSVGDVLMARRGEVGRYALVTEREVGWICGTGSFFVRLASFCDRNYFGLMLEDPRLRAYLLGESVGATMINLNQRILLNAPIAVPPLKEQARIVARVTELRRLCADLRQRLTASQTTQSNLADALVDAVST
jgi:type I restriction enzyme S subunit